MLLNLTVELAPPKSISRNVTQDMSFIFDLSPPPPSIVIFRNVTPRISPSGPPRFLAATHSPPVDPPFPHKNHTLTSLLMVMFSNRRLLNVPPSRFTMRIPALRLLRMMILRKVTFLISTPLPVPNFIAAESLERMQFSISTSSNTSVLGEAMAMPSSCVSTKQSRTMTCCEF